MNYTPDEIAELLKERPNQAHYIAWLVQKAVTEAVLAERERARDYFYEQALAMVEAEREACAKACEARYMGDNNREDAEARRCAAAIRARFAEKSARPAP